VQPSHLRRSKAAARGHTVMCPWLFPDTGDKLRQWEWGRGFRDSSAGQPPLLSWSRDSGSAKLSLEQGVSAGT